jgi:hypothetical protein
LRIRSKLTCATKSYWDRRSLGGIKRGRNRFPLLVPDPLGLPRLAEGVPTHLVSVVVTLRSSWLPLGLRPWCGRLPPSVWRQPSASPAL